jgi:hypothetical protein
MTHSWKPILDNIEARFDAYLEQENRVNRQKMVLSDHKALEPKQPHPSSLLIKSPNPGVSTTVRRNPSPPVRILSFFLGPFVVREVLPKD